MTCTSSAWDDCFVATVTSTPARDGALDIDAINADGIRFIVDDQAPVNMSVFVECGAGRTLRCGGGDLACPGPRNVSYTTPVPGDVLMLAGIQGHQNRRAARRGLIRCATGPDARNKSSSRQQDDGSANADSDVRQTPVLAMIPVDAAPPNEGLLNAFSRTGWS